MLSYPLGDPVVHPHPPASGRPHPRHRARLRSRWRRLNPGEQALLVLAHLRNGDTYTRLAGGFGIGITTAWRYIREAVDLLAATAADLAAATIRVSSLAYAILDGTLIPIDRVADDRPYYSGKHKRHGLNVQVVADPSGELVWASPTLPGATYDLSAARSHGLIAALTEARGDGLRRQGIPGCRRHHPHSVQTPPPAATALGTADRGQPRPRRVAGPRLAQVGGAIGPCEPGNAMATPAFDLDPPVRYVIDTVGPIWEGGSQGEAGVFASCYSRSLQVADELGAKDCRLPGHRHRRVSRAGEN
jgi:hypothetical protein